jgi:hypothetical protein
VLPAAALRAAEFIDPGVQSSGKPPSASASPIAATTAAAILGAVRASTVAGALAVGSWALVAMRE